MHFLIGLADRPPFVAMTLCVFLFCFVWVVDAMCIGFVNASADRPPFVAIRVFPLLFFLFSMPYAWFSLPGCLFAGLLLKVQVAAVDGYNLDSIGVFLVVVNGMVVVITVVRVLYQLCYPDEEEVWVEKQDKDHAPDNQTTSQENPVSISSRV